MTDNGIASIVRSLAEGVDPGRVLRDVVQEAMNRTATSSVLLAAMLEGELTPIVAIGPPHPAMVEAGQEAHASGRPVRRSDPALGLEALAVPVRRRGAVVAVLAVAGPGGSLQSGSLQSGALTAVADCAALALAARPAASVLTGAGASDSGLTLAEALVALASAKTRDQVIVAALDVAAHRYGARAGFVCLPTGPGGVEVVGWRGLDRERLGAASRHPGFTRLVSGTGVVVVAPTDPAVAQLTAGAEFAICLPLESDVGAHIPPRPGRHPPFPGWAGRPRAPRARGAGRRRATGAGGSAGGLVRQPEGGAIRRDRRGRRHPPRQPRPHGGRSCPHGRRRRPLHRSQCRRRRTLRFVGLLRGGPGRPWPSGPPGPRGAAPRRRRRGPRRRRRGGPRPAHPPPLRAGGPVAGRRRPRSDAPARPGRNRCRAGDRRGGGRSRPGAAPASGGDHQPGRRWQSPPAGTGRLPARGSWPRPPASRPWPTSSPS